MFNYPVFNTGGHYDPTTGIYTAPIDGTYEFIFHFESDSDSYTAYLVVNGADVSNDHANWLQERSEHFDLKIKYFEIGNHQY